MERYFAIRIYNYVFVDAVPFSLHIDCRADTDLGWQVEGHSDND